MPPSNGYSEVSAPKPNLIFGLIQNELAIEMQWKRTNELRILDTSCKRLHTQMSIEMCEQISDLFEPFPKSVLSLQHLQPTKCFILWINFRFLQRSQN